MFKIGDRVYYKFDKNHPYEIQPQNDSKKYGKGRIAYFVEDPTEGFKLAVRTDTSHEGKTFGDVLYLFSESQLLTMDAYFKLKESDR